MRKSSSTASSHRGHAGRHGRARRREEAHSGSIDKYSHVEIEREKKEQIFEDVEAHPKGTPNCWSRNEKDSFLSPHKLIHTYVVDTGNKFAALPPTVPAPNTISQPSKPPQYAFTFRCDPNFSTTSQTKESSKDNTVLAPPPTTLPCTNQQSGSCTISALTPPSSKATTKAHASNPAITAPPSPPPILLHNDLHESPPGRSVSEDTPSPEHHLDKQQPPPLHPSFPATSEAMIEETTRKLHRQPTPFPTAKKDKGRSRSNSSKRQDDSVDKDKGRSRSNSAKRHDDAVGKDVIDHTRKGREGKKEGEERKKSGVVKRFIGRISRKGASKAEGEEGWEDGDGEDQGHRLIDEGEDENGGGWEWVGPAHCLLGRLFEQECTEEN